MTNKEYEITKEYWKMIEGKIEEIENIVSNSTQTVNGYMNRKDLHKVDLILEDILKYLGELKDKSDYFDYGSSIEKIDSFICHVHSSNPEEWLYKLQSITFMFPDEITGAEEVVS